VPFEPRNVMRRHRSRTFEPRGPRTIVLEQRHQSAAMASEWDAGGSLTGAAFWDAAVCLNVMEQLPPPAPLDVI
jgi:hypothetical protein